MNIPVQIGDDHYLIRPGFHDGYLEGIALGGGEARLALRCIHDGTHELTLHGLRHLLMNEFREGNIISEIRVVTGAEPDRDVLEALVHGPPHPSVAEVYQQQHRDGLDRMVEEVLAGVTTLVILGPCAGAELLALCTSVSLRKLEVS